MALREKFQLPFKKKPQYTAQNPRLVSEEERLALRARVDAIAEKWATQSEDKRTKAALKKLKKYNSQGKKGW